MSKRRTGIIMSNADNLRNWQNAAEQRREYEENAKVISDSIASDDENYFEEDDDRPSLGGVQAVERQVEGKLAEDVRKRLGVSKEEIVRITESSEDYWLGDETVDTDYRMEIRCAGYVKKFNFYSAHYNFQQLLRWLSEESGSPIGIEEES